MPTDGLWRAAFVNMEEEKNIQEIRYIKANNLVSLFTNLFYDILRPISERFGQNLLQKLSLRSQNNLQKQKNLTIKKRQDKGIVEPSSEKYVSPAIGGRVTFDYSNNNGRYCIGSDELMFETEWTRASDLCIHLYNDPVSIDSVALVEDKSEIREIDDAGAKDYDGSSRCRSPHVGQIAVLKNTNGFWAAIKIISIKDKNRGSACDEVVFDYLIQTNKSPSFVNIA